MRSIKSKLIHFKTKNMKLVSIFFKCNLSIIVVFEAYLFKNNRHNYKQPNTMNIKNGFG